MRELTIDPPTLRGEPCATCGTHSRNLNPDGLCFSCSFDFLAWSGNPAHREAVRRLWIEYTEVASWWLDGELCDLFVHGRTADVKRIEQEFTEFVELAAREGRV